MFCQIKSTLYFAFLALVAGVFVLNVGCSDVSTKRAERNRDTIHNSDTSSRHSTESDRFETLPRQRVDDTSCPVEESPVIEATLQIAEPVVETPTSTPVAEQQSSLPKTINWDTPEEKKATVEDKIATETMTQEAIAETTTVPDENLETYVVAVEPTPEPQTDQVEGDGNPFTAIAESLNQAKPLENADSQIVVLLPESDGAIDEDVWVEAQSIDHDLLERLVIKKTDDNHAWRMQPHSPVDQEAAEDEESSEVFSDSTGLIDAQWQTVEPEPEDALVSEPIIDSTMAPTMTTPVLPSVQTDDDLFGIDTAAAFEQFDQITDDTVTTSPDTMQSPSQEIDFGFDGWGEAESFDPADDTSSPQRPVTLAPSTRPAARPAQPQPMPEANADADYLDVTGALTPVEQYLLNEAQASPVKLMESVELLYKLNKPSLVRRLLRQLQNGELSENDCRQISKRMNQAIMLRISLDPDYQPEGAEVVSIIVEGAKEYYESRDNIEEAVQTLLTGTDREKDGARHTLLSSGETAIEFLLERLAKSEGEELAEVESLLAAMGESARRALQESLVPTTPLGMRAARLLTQMGRASDARFMLPMLFDLRLSDDNRREAADMVQTLSRNVPNQKNAAATLYSMASNYFRGKVPFMTDAENKVSFWMLPEKAEQPKFVTEPEDYASRYFAEKFARFATCLDETNPAYRQLWVAAFFDIKGVELGIDRPITDLIELDEKLLRGMLTGLSVDDIESALRFAMQQDHPIAARVAAELMGEIDDVEAVIYKRGSQSALVKAVGFSDRRVRFAALRSIIKLNPDRPYPGSSVVTQSLVYFTRATGQKRAVVVCPWLGDATNIANLLTPLGFTSETATTGREAMQLAIDSADTELMMLDVRTPSSNVEFLVQDMRADNRTHDVPIAVLANGWQVSRAERAAYGDNRIDAQTSQDTNDRITLNGIEYTVGGDKSRHFIIGDDEFIVERDMMTKAERAAFGSKMAFAFPRPYDEASAQFVVDNLLRESGVEPVPPQLRLTEAKLSIQWVTELYQKPNLYHFENIEQIVWDTLWLPELTDETLPLVELIPTANAQRMLTHIVSTPTFPIETRQAALTAFENNARTNGVLIRGRQILDLYDMYNASGTETVASQQARSDLLDVVEKYANYMQNVSYQK